MTYSLGIDVGATTCAAAVRSDAGLEPCDLGDRTATMPAVALPRGDGTALVGEEADRVSPYEPALVARMVTMGLLDAEPVAIDGVPCHPLPLTEALLDAVIERAAQPDERPEHVMVAYPLREGGGPERLLAEAAHRVTGGAAVLVPAPIAAAAKLAHDRDLGPDMLVVVVDFGGTSVDITLVRCTPEVFDLVGDPTSLTDLGGVDLDAEVVSLVESAIGDVTSTVGPDDRAGMLALRRMRASCRAAKERLSIDDAAIVDVAIPQARAQIEITRDAFERMIFPRLDGAVDTVLATIEDAGLLPADLGLALVTGGSAHIPLFAGLMAERTGLTVVVDDEPQLTVAMGAALFADVADLMPGIAQVPTPAPAPRESYSADPPAPPAPEPQPLPQPPVDQPYAAGPPLDPAPPEPPPPRSMPVPPLRTGELWPAAIDAGWTPDGVGWASDDDWQPEPDDVWPNTARQWEDSRTSVFEPPPPAAPPPLPPPAPPVGDHDQFQRLTTSDTDPFGSRSSSLAARRRERDDDWADDDEDDRAGVDLRVVVGGAVAAVFLVVLAGFAVLSGAGGDSGPIAVADTVATTTSSTTEPTGADTAALTNSSTTSSTSSTSTSTTEAPQDEPTTTSPPEPEPDPDPGPPPPPPPPPPPTAPPTTRPRPTTTSTTSTSTTSTSTTSTSTVPQAGT